MDERMRIALLIDADNAPASKIDVVLAELARHGIANVRRAYGNWKNPTLQKWEQALHPNAIQPMQQIALSTGKNASDMAMVVDAMDLLHSARFDAFAIVSSDADFTPLVMRLRAQNMRVFGFGEKKTPEPFVNACSTFLYVDAPMQAGRTSPDATPATPPKRKTAAELRGDTTLVNLLRDAVDASKDDDDGWANLGAVGHFIANRASFDPRNHGYAKLKGLIKEIGLFELREDGLQISIRALPKPKPTAPKAATPKTGRTA